VLAAGGVPAVLAAQQPHSRQKTAQAVRVSQPPVLDGRLTEAAWASAPAFSDFVQKEPQEGQPPTERTEVKVLFDGQAVYFGIRCADSSPNQIVATERRRDQDLTKDDSISIVLDIFHDHRSAYLFSTNPLGTQYDALISEEGNELNESWDERWQVAAAIVNESAEPGWSAELRIPYQILRGFKEGDQVWGLDVRRIIRRKNEWLFWQNYTRDFRFEQVSQAGHLEGLRELRTGDSLRIKPYILTHGLWTEPDTPRAGAGLDYGIEDLKYRITPSVTADLTYRPDFAQTEVDDLRLNVTRFPVFFPEKREFFLEGSGLFDFGSGVARSQSDLKLFFSRRIGLSERRSPIPLLGGGKLTGKLDKFAFGALNMVTKSTAEGPAANFVLFRVKRDLFDRSYVGAMVTSVDPRGGPYNRAYGVDANFVLFQNLNLQGLVAQTREPGVSSGNVAHYVRGIWERDLVFAQAERFVIPEQFRPGMGWVPRRDQNKSTLDLEIRPRPDIRGIRQLFFRTNQEYIVNRTRGVVESRRALMDAEVNFQTDDCLGVFYERVFERLFETFRIQPDVQIPAGDYRNRSLRINYYGNPARVMSGPRMQGACEGPPLFKFVREWDFYEGNRMEVDFSPQLKLTDRVLIDVDFSLNKVKLPAGRYTETLINARVNYSFNNRWLTSTTVQYDSLAKRVNFRTRLNFIFRQGDDFFLVYTHGRVSADGRVPGGRDPILSDTSLVAKLTYSLGF